MPVTNQKLRPVCLLSAPEEMRYPYERAFKSIGVSAVWFDRYEDFANADPLLDPLAIVVDIDNLPKPLEEKLEGIRLAFPQTDLVALSASDSAQLALLCVRSGFSDFLLKPTSPEELLWSLKKSQQRHELFSKFDDTGTTRVRALTQISACGTPALVRLCSMEYLQRHFQSAGVAWLSFQKQTPKVVCSLPRGLRHDEILGKLPSLTLWDPLPPGVTWSKKSKDRKVFLSCQNGHEGVFLWGIQSKVAGEKLIQGKSLLEHSELTLLNLQKFDEIKQQTFMDELTGLYNSRYLKFAVSNAIQKGKKSDSTFGILFIDVDHFKQVNTEHGHIIGSEFLVAIGKTIRNNIRVIDPVFRYGGDEFVVLLNDASIDGSKEIAERIRKNIERRVFSIQGFKLRATVSIGIAVYPVHASDQESILKLADEAMYSAKEQSRNAIHLYGAEPATSPLKKVS